MFSRRLLSPWAKQHSHCRANRAAYSCRATSGATEIATPATVAELDDVQTQTAATARRYALRQLSSDNKQSSISPSNRRTHQGRDVSDTNPLQKTSAVGRAANWESTSRQLFRRNSELGETARPLWYACFSELHVRCHECVQVRKPSHTSILCKSIMRLGINPASGRHALEH